MGEMKLKLTHGPLKSIVTRMLSKLVCEKLGYNISLELNEIGITNVDGKVSIHLNADANMTNSEFTKLVKAIGLE